MSKQGKLLLPNVAADRLGVTDRHVRRLCKQGKLHGVKLTERGLRIPEAALESYRQEQDEKG